jgi:hypothetical protein
MDSGCQFGAQQTSVGRLVSQPPHSRKSGVDSSGSKAALLQVKSITQNHGFVDASRGSEQYQATNSSMAC